MIMTNEELCREYRQAKTPLKQIRILADENGCTKREIAEILREAGEELPAQFVKGPPRPKAETERQALEGAGLIFPMPVRDEEILLPDLNTGRVAMAAGDAIARLLKALDTGGYGEAEAYNFVEQVRGVLMLAHTLTETEDEE